MFNYWFTISVNRPLNIDVWIKIPRMHAATSLIIKTKKLYSQCAMEGALFGVSPTNGSGAALAMMTSWSVSRPSIQLYDLLLSCMTSCSNV